MIRPIFDRLPGPVWLRILFALIVIVALAWVCHVWLFPMLDVWLFPVDPVQVSGTTG